MDHPQDYYFDNFINKFITLIASVIILESSTLQAALGDKEVEFVYGVEIQRKACSINNWFRSLITVWKSLCNKCPLMFQYPLNFNTFQYKMRLKHIGWLGFLSACALSCMLINRPNIAIFWACLIYNFVYKLLNLTSPFVNL